MLFFVSSVHAQICDNKDVHSSQSRSQSLRGNEIVFLSEAVVAEQIVDVKRFSVSLYFNTAHVTNSLSKP